MKAVTYSPEALKALRKHSNMADRLRRAIEEYAAIQVAHANRVTQLIGSNKKRLRVGGFRILFDETDDRIVVAIVGPRGSVYD